MAHFPRPPSAGLQIDTAAYVMYAQHNKEEHDAYVKELWAAVERYEDVVKAYGVIEEIRALKAEEQKALDRTEAVCRKREDALSDREDKFKEQVAESQQQLEAEQAKFSKESTVAKRELAERSRKLSLAEDEVEKREKDATRREAEIKRKMDLISRKDELAKAFLAVE